MALLETVRGRVTGVAAGVLGTSGRVVSLDDAIADKPIRTSELMSIVPVGQRRMIGPTLASELGSLKECVAACRPCATVSGKAALRRRSEDRYREPFAERRLTGTRITRLTGTSAPASGGGSVN